MDAGAGVGGAEGTAHTPTGTRGRARMHLLAILLCPPSHAQTQVSVVVEHGDSDSCSHEESGTQFI